MRVGALVAVSGTTASGGDGLLLANNAGVQAREVLQRIGLALERAGGSLADVIRTRIYLVAMSDLEEVGRVHGEFFASVRPATTAVQVAALADPAMLVEIEADAVMLTKSSQAR